MVVDFIGVTLACEGLGHTSTSAMVHHHQWQSEPPEGKLYWSKSFDQRYGDEEDMASNAMLTSQEEIQRLRLLLRENPEFEFSSSWPSLVEWCSTCTATSMVRLVLPEEEIDAVVKEEKAMTESKVEEEKPNSCEATAKDVCTQTPGRRRRRGGRGSRMRRLLAFQLMLTEKKGMPLSRLLTLKKSDAKNFKRKELRRLQEESASPMLKKVESQETEVKVNLEDMKKEEGCFSKGASAGGSSIFTPRSSPSDVATPTFDSSPLPTMPPSPPSFVWLPTPPYTTFYSPRPWDLMPGHQWLICGACHSWGNVIMS